MLAGGDTQGGHTHAMRSTLYRWCDAAAIRSSVCICGGCQHADNVVVDNWTLLLLSVVLLFSIVEQISMLHNALTNAPLLQSN